MTEIKALDVKKLREQTGAGMMDCKQALTATAGNLEEAVVWLRKKGLAAASKKSGRAAAEGLVGVELQGNAGVIVELNAETDFVARNDKFQSLLSSVLKLAVTKDLSLEELLASPYEDKNHSVADEITNNIAVIGENMNLRRVKRVEVSEGVVTGYIHNAVVENLGKIAVLVALKSSASKELLNSLGKKIAMHIAAMRPESLNTQELDPAKIEKEKEIFFDQAIKSGKPKEIVEKMVDGRIAKFYKEVVLLEQQFVLDNSLTVKEFIEAEAKKASTPIELVEFARFELGEGIELEEKDFAAEVASISKA